MYWNWTIQVSSTSISINDIDNSELVVSNKFSFDKQDFKCFIGYKDDKKIWPLYILFPEMSIYKRYFDKTKYVLW